ncbi:MAG: helix-turn-helix domain-containing protein, partial [Actinomycetota bacterium]
MSVGARLRAARRAAGLTVEQVSAATRIRPHLVRALEADDLAACGAPVYARGHLRALANVLNLDPATLLDELPPSSPPAPGLRPAAARGAGRATTGGRPGGSGRRRPPRSVRGPTRPVRRPVWPAVAGVTLAATLRAGGVRWLTLPGSTPVGALTVGGEPVPGP